MLNKKNLIKANNIAMLFFCKELNKAKKAKEYLLNRLDKRTIDDFKLGYAPKGGLIDLLEKENLIKEAVHLGLIGEKNDYYYDVFSDRIMIPIFFNGKVIAFGGRTISDHPTKYLNSKSSLLYNKSSVLFGIDQNKKYIHNRNYAVVLEGYFDVMGLYNKGIKTGLACCGTALKNKHILLIKRWTDRVFTNFDGDDAGKEAAIRAKKELKKEGIFQKNIILPEGYDPDEYVNEFGRKKYISLFEL